VQAQKRHLQTWNGAKWLAILTKPAGKELGVEGLRIEIARMEEQLQRRIEDYGAEEGVSDSTTDGSCGNWRLPTHNKQKEVGLTNKPLWNNIAWRNRPRIQLNLGIRVENSPKNNAANEHSGPR